MPKATEISVISGSGREPPPGAGIAPADRHAADGSRWGHHHVGYEQRDQQEKKDPRDQGTDDDLAGANQRSQGVGVGHVRHGETLPWKDVGGLTTRRSYQDVVDDMAMNIR